MSPNKPSCTPKQQSKNSTTIPLTGENATGDANNTLESPPEKNYIRSTSQGYLLEERTRVYATFFTNSAQEIDIFKLFSIFGDIDRVFKIPMSKKSVRETYQVNFRQAWSALAALRTSAMLFNGDCIFIQSNQRSARKLNRYKRTIGFDQEEGELGLFSP